MRYEKIVLCMLVFAAASSLVNAASESPLAALEEFYRAGTSEDMQDYLAAQDTEFLYLAEKESDVREWFQAHFDEFDTLSTEIIEPQVLQQEYGSLIFYNLKAQVKQTSSGQTVNIDNDMVAFTIPREGGHVVRWTILRSMFRDKLDAHASMMSAYALTQEEVREETLAEQYEAAEHEEYGEADVEVQGIEEEKGFIGKIVSLIAKLALLGLLLGVLSAGIFIVLRIIRSRKHKSHIQEQAEREDRRAGQQEKQKAREESKKEDAIQKDAEHPGQEAVQQPPTHNHTHLIPEEEKSGKKKFLALGGIGIIAFIVIGLLVVGGAGLMMMGALGGDDDPGSGKEDSQKTQAVTCSSPYIRHGSSCCLDQDDNNICDKDEEGAGSTTPTTRAPTTTVKTTTTAPPTTSTPATSPPATSPPTTVPNPCGYPDKKAPPESEVLEITTSYGQEIMGYSFKVRSTSKDAEGCIEKVYLYLRKPNGAQDTTVHLDWTNTGEFTEQEITTGLMDATSTTARIWAKFPCRISGETPEKTETLTLKDMSVEHGKYSYKLAETLYTGECPTSAKVEVRENGKIIKTLIPSWKVSPKVDDDTKIGLAKIINSEQLMIWVSE